MNSISAALLVVTSVAVTLPSHTQQQTQGSSLVIGPGEVQVADLVEKVSRFLGENHITDPNDPIFTSRDSPLGKLVLSNRLEFDRKSGRAVLQELLFVKNLVLTPIDPGRKLFEWIGCGSRIEQPGRSRPKGSQGPAVKSQGIVWKELVQMCAPPYRIQDAKPASWEGRHTRVRPRAGAS